MAIPTELQDCGLDLKKVKLVITCLYFVLFVPALLLNITAAWISWSLKTKSSFVVYLKSLVAADLLMTLTIPLKAGSEFPYAPHWLRAFACQFSSVVFYLCMYMSMIQMGLISLDRFFKIVKPGGRRLGHSALLGKVVVVVIWVLYLSVNTVPTMVLTNEKPENNTAELCMAMKNDLGKAYHKAIVIECNVIFLVVLLLIGVCYTCITKKVIESYRKSGSTNAEGNKKIKARVFIVLFVFLVCFTPYHITRFPYVERQVENKINCNWASLKVAKSFTLWLSSTNVCMDPFIYILLCKDFREKLYELRIFRHWFATKSLENTDDSSVSKG
ncbi:P2Y purinoceptor 13-like [Engraulis encrasicolus]|uniref:P2Y purinoceptor 13-like n=1 Tax=Engraulis encrasicolus TaxID=184585 RepID=UPI002FD55033